MLAPRVVVMIFGLIGAPPAAEPPTEARVRETVGRSLTYLQEESVDWIHERKCASCHHAALTIWTAHEAKSRGYAVDQAALDEITSWTLRDPVQSKMLPAPKKPDEKPGPNDQACLPTAYAALAASVVPAEALGPAESEVRRRLTSHLVEKQQPDGSWAHGGGRPPMLESQETATLMTLLALTAPAKNGESAVSASRRKAEEWLKQNAKAGSHQARVLRLLVAVRAGAAPESWASELESILKAQNGDGGWSQTPELKSDAFATGQTLYVLILAGLPPDKPEVGQARAFLVAQQAEDGSWPMTSRPASPGGGPAKDLRPITAAATAWATLALVRSSPR